MTSDFIKQKIRGFQRRMRDAQGIQSIPGAALRWLGKKEPITVVDVGAFDGEFVTQLGWEREIERAVLVEPLPEKAEALRRKFTDPRYSIFQCAVSDKAGTVDFFVNERQVMSSLLPTVNDPAIAQWNVFGKASPSIRVETRPLDAIVEESGIQSIDLLKIDVQGAERLALRGATQTLAMTRLLWIEVSFRPVYENSPLFQEMYETFQGLGFRLMDLIPVARLEGELVQSDAVFLRR